MFSGSFQRTINIRQRNPLPVVLRISGIRKQDISRLRIVRPDRYVVPLCILPVRSIIRTGYQHDGSHCTFHCLTKILEAIIFVENLIGNACRFQGLFQKRPVYGAIAFAGSIIRNKLRIIIHIYRRAFIWCHGSIYACKSTQATSKYTEIAALHIEFTPFPGPVRFCIPRYRALHEGVNVFLPKIRNNIL